MTAIHAHPWLDRLYLAALVLHGGVLALLAMAVLWVTFGTRMADSAPDHGAGAILIRMIQLLWLVPLAIVPAVVVLSHRFARRLGNDPSPGHKGLAVAGALPFVGFFLWVLLQ